MMPHNSADVVFIASYRPHGPKKILVGGSLDVETMVDQPDTEFFHWYDPAAPKYSANLLNGLMKKSKQLIVDLNAHKEELMALKEELETQKSEKNLIAANLELYKRNAKMWKWLFSLILISLIGKCFQLF